MTKHAHAYTLFGLVAASLLLAACESMPTPVNRPKPAAATGPQSLADLIAAG